MPSRKTPDGEFKDIAHPINTHTREILQDSILSEYAKVMDEDTPYPYARERREHVEEEENILEKEPMSVQ